MANFITSIRILCSLLLFFTQPFSSYFYILYLVAGFSDMIDGSVARMTHSESKLGEKLDSIADMIMLVICFIKLFPYIQIPLYIWIWIGSIGFLKSINMIRRKNVVPHTKLNKIAGLLLFFYPFFLNNEIYTILACCVATMATCLEMKD